MPIEKDEEREDRIIFEVVVDAYDREERIMGWYYYLAEGISFPFNAQCIAERGSSPLKIGEEVEVVDMSDMDDCQRGMLVQIRLMDRTFGVPLEQVKPIDVDEQSLEKIEDWHYWAGRGYEL